MVGRESINRSKKMKRLLVVMAIFVILVSSATIIDVYSAAFEYEISEPSLSHGFPETLIFYNISEGVTGNLFSIIFELPTYHSGHHHIIPREFSLLFCFKDNATGSDLSPFIMDVWDILRNSTLNYNLHWYDPFEKFKDGWWIPSHLRFVLNERPDVDSVRCGILFELILVNHFGDSFDGHELNVQLRMNVTYSRWWYGFQVNPTHQTIEYAFDLPADGVADIQSLDF